MTPNVPYAYAHVNNAMCICVTLSVDKPKSVENVGCLVTTDHSVNEPHEYAWSCYWSEDCQTIFGPL